MTRVCAQPGCPALTRTTYCPIHRDPNAHRSPNRDRAAQARFRRQVLTRDAGRCVVCGSTIDLRAHHTRPLHQGGGYDPSEGVTLCATHDRQADRWAR